MKKNLSILIYSLAGGGAERIVSVLTQELSKNYNITLVLMNNTINYNIEGVNEIIYLEKSKANENGLKKLLKLPLLAIKYRAILKKYNIDISLSLLTRPNYISILSQLFSKKIRIIISEHSFPSRMYKGNNLKSIINRFMIFKLYNRADKVIAISKLIEKDLQNNFNIKKDKLVQIYNPFDLEYIDNLSKEKVNFSFDKFTFITAGRLDDGKNHKLIIEAFKLLQNNNTQLLILGEGKNKDKLNNLIKKYHLEDRIFLIGFDPNPYKYMSKSNCFILSSNYEGLPTVIIEAMACNLQIISTDCKSGPREILAPYTDIKIQLNNNIEITPHGILTPINNTEMMLKAMNYILNNKKLYNNKLRAQYFAKDNIIKKYINIL